MIRRLRRLPGHLRPRRLRVYGIGLGKSGTTSLARMFGMYRAAHEVDARRLLPVATAVLQGELATDSARVRAELRRRSLRFHLEVDAAPFLMPFAEALALLYPDGRFVLTIRDCFSWLDSRVEWDLRHPPSAVPMFAPFRSALYPRYDEVFAPEEAALEKAGLRPIASYLRSWRERNEEALRHVPASQLLVVRTEDLDRSTATLARFAGVPEPTVRPAHANSNPHRTGILGRVPRDFVVARVQEHSAELMAGYWGAKWYKLETWLPARRD